MSILSRTFALCLSPYTFVRVNVDTMLPTYAVAIGALAYSAMAQTAAFNMTLMNLNNVATGQILPIVYTAGDGTDISIAFKNTSWTEVVVRMSSR